ncbi:MAG: cell division protein ZapA [Romboutsia sp.]
MNKVMVTIHGAQYPMVGDKSEQHMSRVAEYVDTEMNKVTQKNPRLSLAVATIVAALNITDLLFECSELNDELTKENKELSKKVGSPDEELKLEIRKSKLELEQKEQELSENNAKIEELTKIIEAQRQEISNLGNKSEGSKVEVESYKSQIEELTAQVDAESERARIAESLSSEFQNKAYSLQLKYTELEHEFKYIIATK